MRTERQRGGFQMDDPISTILLVLMLVFVFVVPWKSCGTPDNKAAAPAQAGEEARK